MAASRNLDGDRAQHRLRSKKLLGFGYLELPFYRLKICVSRLDGSPLCLRTCEGLRPAAGCGWPKPKHSGRVGVGS
ncbi:hypothetical protein C0J52_16583 [Blattella germanica]|nr:hypothetical protein C0J52_16583 [Blattella germanica]